MRTNFRKFVFIFIFLLGSSLPKLNASVDEEVMAESPQIKISMDFQDADLKNVIKVLSIQSGMNFVASEAVQDRKLTLYLDKVPLNEALNKIFKANNLTYELDKNSNIFIVKDWGKPEIETITQVFYLRFATVSTSSLKEEMKNYESTPISTSITSTSTSGTATNTTTSTGSSSSSGGKWQTEKDSGITSIIKKLLSSNGTVIEDYRTNSLIVTDIPSRMNVIAQTIKALDVAVPQVMLEVEMLDVNKNAIDRIGIKWANNLTSSMFSIGLAGAGVTTPFPVAKSFIDGKALAGSGKQFTEGIMNFFNGSTGTSPYNMFIDFIKQLADTKVLARPRILTLNNETAEIKIVTAEAIGSISLSSGLGSAATTTTSAERVETGVSLRVTPQINSDTGDITMFIQPTVTDATTSSTFTGGSTSTPLFKDPEERTTRSLVRIKDGETVILGGLIRHDKSETVTKVPILGDIPLIGGAFRHRYKDKDKERELIVFLTPHIIKDAYSNKTELAKLNPEIPPMRIPQREQETVSVMDRQAVIKNSLNNFERR